MQRDPQEAATVMQARDGSGLEQSDGGEVIEKKFGLGYVFKGSHQGMDDKSDRYRSYRQVKALKVYPENRLGG